MWKCTLSELRSKFNASFECNYNENEDGGIIYINENKFKSVMN